MILCNMHTGAALVIQANFSPVKIIKYLDLKIKKLRINKPASMFAPIARERVSDPRSDPSTPCRARDLAQLAPSQKKTAKAAERTTTAEKEVRASSSFVPAAE